MLVGLGDQRIPVPVPLQDIIHEALLNKILLRKILAFHFAKSPHIENAFLVCLLKLNRILQGNLRRAPELLLDIEHRILHNYEHVEAAELGEFTSLLDEVLLPFASRIL